jgi:hypothetical protein
LQGELLRLSGGQVESLFAMGLPVEVRELPADLAALDALLGDPALLAPVERAWDAAAREVGRPTIPIQPENGAPGSALQATVSRVHEASGSRGRAARPGADGEQREIRQAVIGITNFCDNVEPKPYFGADEATQRKCAANLAPFVESVQLTVDGGNPVDLQTRRYQIFSPQRHVQLLADNFLGVPPGPATFAAWGWVAWLKDLPPGVHTLGTASCSTMAASTPGIWSSTSLRTTTARTTTNAGRASRGRLPPRTISGGAVRSRTMLRHAAASRQMR